MRKLDNPADEANRNVEGDTKGDMAKGAVTSAAANAS